MASISEKTKDGKLTAFKFVTCLGRDRNNRQIRKATTWTAPADLTPAKARKAAIKAAAAWEQQMQAEFSEQQSTGVPAPCVSSKTDFLSFVNEVWFPLQVEGNNRKPTTTAFYRSAIIILGSYFDGFILQSISPIDIQKYLSYLRTDYPGKNGQGLAPKTVHHQYNTLNLIFDYAEQQELIAKNPMARVSSPKKEKHPVDALSPEDAKRFLYLLESASPEFRCMMKLLLTTGLRRGELVGLQWRDMGMHSVHPEFKGIKRLGIFNPRLNSVYLLDIGTIAPETIREVETDVIGY